MSGVEVLRRTLPHALAVADPGGSEPLDWSGSEYVDRMAADLVAGWSPADRLEVAGITEERLADALCHGRGLPEPPGHRLAHLESARLVLAALTEQEPATPVTPEGGER